MSGNIFIYDVICEYINTFEDDFDKEIEINVLIDYLERFKKDIKDGAEDD